MKTFQNCSRFSCHLAYWVERERERERENKRYVSRESHEDETQVTV